MMRSGPIDPKPGEVWFADLGLVEKSRPVLIICVPGDADARALTIVAPLTSQIRGLRGEFFLGKPRWLPKISAVNLQGLSSIDASQLVRRMGELSSQQWVDVKSALRELLNL